MKKWTITILLLVTALLLCACGKLSKGATDELIKSDIIAHAQFPLISENELDIDTITINKRMTDAKEKKDDVWVTVNGSNQDIEATRHYILHYTYYNDGWQFDWFELYQDTDHLAMTKPLHGVDEQDVFDYINGADFTSHATYDPDLILSSNIDISSIDESTIAEGYLNVGAVMNYHYSIVDEQFLFQIHYEFLPEGESDQFWSWQPMSDLEYVDFERTLFPNDGIIGDWKGQCVPVFGSYTYAEINISGYNGTEIYVDSVKAYTPGSTGAFGSEVVLHLFKEESGVMEFDQYGHQLVWCDGLTHTSSICVGVSEIYNTTLGIQRNAPKVLHLTESERFGTSNPCRLTLESMNIGS